MRRVQFSIRSLMIAVVIVACVLALLKKGPESLLLVLLLGIPMAVLSERHGDAQHRKPTAATAIASLD